MEIDIHGLHLWEAIDEIIYFLEECRLNGIQEISIVHGYHHGKILKDYIRSDGFIKEMRREGFSLKKIKSSNEGVTRFLIK
jgi:dsDNA-specific endonuclease/ATPase MutS2